MRTPTRARLCSDCHTRTEFRFVTEEYERGGVRVRISGIPAMVCPNCGAVSFPAGVTTRVAEAANALFAVTEEQRCTVWMAADRIAAVS